MKKEKRGDVKKRKGRMVRIVKKNCMINMMEFGIIGVL